MVGHQRSPLTGQHFLNCFLVNLMTWDLLTGIPPQKVLWPIIWGNAELESEQVFIRWFRTSKRLLLNTVFSHYRLTPNPPHQCLLIPHSSLLMVKSMDHDAQWIMLLLLLKMTSHILFVRLQYFFLRLGIATHGQQLQSSLTPAQIYLFIFSVPLKL